MTLRHPGAALPDHRSIFGKMKIRSLLPLRPRGTDKDSILPQPPGRGLGTIRTRHRVEPGAARSG